MERKPLISVVVPVYNVAPYLRRCLDSLLAQTFRNFELVLVDDGSNDGSSSICDEYADRNAKSYDDGNAKSYDDVRVKVIHQANAGVSAARNRGMAEACGEYISFVDADDWVEPRFLQAFADEAGADLLVQGYVNHESKPISWPLSHYTTATELCASLFELERKRLVGYVWNKLFRRQIIVEHHVAFDQAVPIGEDFLFCMTFISHCQCMTVVPFIGYNYFYPPGDFKEYSFTAWNHRLDGVHEVWPHFECISPKVLDQFKAREFKLGLYILRILYHERQPRQERMEFLTKIKDRVRGNKELHISSYERDFWMLAVCVLYLPLHLCDHLLMAIRRLR